FGELDPDMSTRFLVRINRRKVRLLGCVLHNERHADANGECDSRGHPKQPAPVQRRNPDQTEKRKSGEQRGPKLENPKPAEVDHKTEDTSKAAALGMPEPSRVNFHHSGCAECLEVAVDPTNQSKQPEQAPERSDAKRDIHNDGACRSDEHGAFSAETICEKAIYDQTAGIGEQGSCDDVAHLRFAEPEFAADCAIRERQIITAHVKRRVKQANEGPIQSAAWAKSRRMRSKNGSIRRVSHSRRMREYEAPTQREMIFLGAASERHRCA